MIWKLSLASCSDQLEVDTSLLRLSIERGEQTELSEINLNACITNKQSEQRMDDDCWPSMRLLSSVWLQMVSERLRVGYSLHVSESLKV